MIGDKIIVAEQNTQEPADKKVKREDTEVNELDDEDDDSQQVCVNTVLLIVGGLINCELHMVTRCCGALCYRI